MSSTSLPFWVAEPAPFFEAPPVGPVAVLGLAAVLFPPRAFWRGGPDFFISYLSCCQLSLLSRHSARPTSPDRGPPIHSTPRARPPRVDQRYAHFTCCRKRMRGKFSSAVKNCRTVGKTRQKKGELKESMRSFLAVLQGVHVIRSAISCHYPPVLRSCSNTAPLVLTACYVEHTYVWKVHNYSDHRYCIPPSKLRIAIPTYTTSAQTAQGVFCVGREC